MKLKDQVVLITGGSRGIGREISRLLAIEGANIAINYVKHDEAAISIEQEIKTIGAGDVILIKTSITKPELVENMIDTVCKKYGKIDILINNAGILRIGYFAGTSPRDWQEIIDINLYGCYNCCKAVLPYMKSRKKGKIINICSFAGLAGLFDLGHAVYAASKAAAIGFTRALAKELAPLGIIVNGIAPGLIDTDMLKYLPIKIKENFCENIPLKRFGLAKEVAATVLFLASDSSSYLSGEIIVIDGGWLS